MPKTTQCEARTSVKGGHSAHRCPFAAKPGSRFCTIHTRDQRPEPQPPETLPGVPANFGQWCEDNGLSLGGPVGDRSGRLRAIVDLDVLRLGVAELIHLAGGG